MKAKTHLLPLATADLTEREMIKGISAMLLEIDASLRRSRTLSEEIEELKQESQRVRAARRTL